MRFITKGFQGSIYLRGLVRSEGGLDMAATTFGSLAGMTAVNAMLIGAVAVRRRILERLWRPKRLVTSS